MVSVALTNRPGLDAAVLAKGLAASATPVSASVQTLGSDAKPGCCSMLDLETSWNKEGPIAISRSAFRLGQPGGMYLMRGGATIGRRRGHR